MKNDCCKDCLIPEHDTTGEDYKGAVPDACRDEGCDCHMSASNPKLSESALRAVNTPLIGADGKKSNMGHTNLCADFAENGLCDCPLKGRGGQCSTSGVCSHNTNGRSMDKPCSISAETIKSDWQRRFLDVGTVEMGIDCSPLIGVVSLLRSEAAVHAIQKFVDGTNKRLSL
jgi:hypothetical protein